jgi:ATP-dependent protease Clp ATPase subunit
VPHLSFIVEPRPLTGDPRKQCSFCLREMASLGQLVAAPVVSICGDCVGRCVRELEARRVKGWRRWWDLRPRSRMPARQAAPPYRAGDSACSFCGDSDVDETIVAEHARICPPCVRLAVDIIREQAGRA